MKEYSTSWRRLITFINGNAQIKDAFHFCLFWHPILAASCSIQYRETQHPITNSQQGHEPGVVPSIDLTSPRDWLGVYTWNFQYSWISVFGKLRRKLLYTADWVFPNLPGFLVACPPWGKRSKREWKNKWIIELETTSDARQEIWYVWNWKI